MYVQFKILFQHNDSCYNITPHRHLISKIASDLIMLIQILNNEPGKLSIIIIKLYWEIRTPDFKRFSECLELRNKSTFLYRHTKIGCHVLITSSDSSLQSFHAKVFNEDLRPSQMVIIFGVVNPQLKIRNFDPKGLVNNCWLGWLKEYSKLWHHWYDTPKRNQGHTTCLHFETSFSNLTTNTVWVKRIIMNNNEGSMSKTYWKIFLSYAKATHVWGWSREKPKGQLKNKQKRCKQVIFFILGLKKGHNYELKLSPAHHIINIAIFLHALVSI